MNNPFLDLLVTDTAPKPDVPVRDDGTAPALSYSCAESTTDMSHAPSQATGNAAPVGGIENHGAESSFTSPPPIPIAAPAQSQHSEPAAASDGASTVQQSASTHNIAPESRSQPQPPPDQPSEHHEALKSEGPDAGGGGAVTASRSSSSHGLIPPPPKPQPRSATEESIEAAAATAAQKNADAVAREAAADAEFAAKTVEGFDPGFEAKFEKAGSPTHSPPATDCSTVGAATAGAPGGGGGAGGEGEGANAAAWESEASKAVLVEAAIEAKEEPEVFEPFRKEAEGVNEWRLLMRYPEKKKLSGTRTWRNVIVRYSLGANS